MRELVWVGSSLDDLKSFPEPVQKSAGYALYLAQCGAKHPTAKPLKGVGGAGGVEIVTDFDGDTFRSVYTVRLRNAVYVLHAFQKKSRRGSEASKHDLDLIARRLRWAEDDAARRSHEEPSND